MYKIFILKNYKAQLLTICNINELKRVFNGQKAIQLIVKLINISKIKYIRINLSNLKIY